MDLLDTHILLVETDHLCWGASLYMSVSVGNAPKTDGRKTADDTGWTDIYIKRWHTSSDDISLKGHLPTLSRMESTMS